MIKRLYCFSGIRAKCWTDGWMGDWLPLKLEIQEVCKKSTEGKKLGSVENKSRNSRERTKQKHGIFRECRVQKFFACFHVGCRKILLELSYDAPGLSVDTHVTLHLKRTYHALDHYLDFWIVKQYGLYKVQIKAQHFRIGSYQMSGKFGKLFSV